MNEIEIEQLKKENREMRDLIHKLVALGMLGSRFLPSQQSTLIVEEVPVVPANAIEVDRIA